VSPRTGEKIDVFVSYAHADDHDGWVSELLRVFQETHDRWDDHSDRGCRTLVAVNCQRIVLDSGSTTDSASHCTDGFPRPLLRPVLKPLTHE
jgi:hypothetical protein